MNGPRIEDVQVSVFRIPTDGPESDGTFTWNHTTLVVVEISAGGVRALGYTYSARAAAAVIADSLRPLAMGQSAFDHGRISAEGARALRNLGCCGIGAQALSAFDTALWDLHARILQVSLPDLLGRTRDSVRGYGSGGFTSYDTARLQQQLGGWAAEGFRSVKMKVGRDPVADPKRVQSARAAIGDAELYVDANGAYSQKQALQLAEVFAQSGVTWFEEPVSSQDIDGLRLIRQRAPAAIRIAAGEYGWDVHDFLGLVEGGAVDVLQADATRCRGVTGFLEASQLCKSHGLLFSAHTAPSLHAQLACAVPDLLDVECFHDHLRIEAMLFEGAVLPRAGMLTPDRSRPGLGLELKRADARAFEV